MARPRGVGTEAAGGCNQNGMGRRWLTSLAALVGALALACTSFLDPSPAVSPSPSQTALAERTFNPGSFNLYFPAEIQPGAAEPNCGSGNEKKLAVRIDPPRQAAVGVWKFDGCIASKGNVFYDVTVLFTFPDGESIPVRVLDATDSVRDVRFVAEIRRPSVADARATVYCNYTAKGI